MKRNQDNKSIILIITATILVSLYIYNVNKNPQDIKEGDKDIKDKIETTVNLTNYLTAVNIPGNDKEIDNEEISIKNTTAKISRKTPQDQTVTYQIDQSHKISFTPVNSPNIGGINERDLSIEANKYYYENIYNGIDLIYTRKETSLLEEYEVKTKRNISYLIQKIDMENLSYEELDEGSYVFYSTITKEKMFSLPKPVMYEKFNERNRSYGIEYKIIDTNEYTFLIKEINEMGREWLNNAKYPVMIDGTIFTQDLVLESYPVIAGIWTVRADTVGTDTLTFSIDPAAEFRQIFCGENELEATRNDTDETKFYIENYSCASDTLIKYSLSEIGTYAMNVSFGNVSDQTQTNYSTENSSSVFLSINQYPIYVQPGDLITVTAEISDINGVTFVEADLGDDLPTIELNLIEGDEFNGTWQGTWTAVGTGPITYYTQIFATNSLGNITESELIEWSDWSCDLGGDHGGSDFNPVTDCSGQDIAGVHTNIGSFSLPNANIAYVKDYDGNDYGSVEIQATDVTIDGTLSANGKGYRGGARETAGEGPSAGGADWCSGGGGGGHAGNGGNGNNTSGGTNPYGNYLMPATMGSSGGGGGTCAAYSSGGDGGGIIKISSTGTTSIDGTVSANGITPTPTKLSGGGGAGGSIYINTVQLTGTGNITVNGGNGDNDQGDAGNGGGGRIYIAYSSTNSFSGTLSAISGTYSGRGGENGTALIVDSTNNDLYIETDQIWKSNPSLEGSAHSYRNITLDGSANLFLRDYYTNDADGIGFVFSCTNFDITAGSILNSEGGGFLGGTYETAGDGPGGGATNSCAGGGGGGHAYYGGTGSTGASGGDPYGNTNQPTTLGSGGGGGWACGNTPTLGGAGGGAVKINASNIITVNGSIDTDGVDVVVDNFPGGGGAGGSIYLIADTVEGSGSITADGGNGANDQSDSGNGSGGRIAINYATDYTFNGVLSADTGTGGLGGGNGTVVVISSTTNDLQVLNDQRWFADPDLEGAVHHYRNINIGNSSILTLVGYYTSDSNGFGHTFRVNNFYVEAGSIVNLEGQGYPGGPLSTDGQGPGKGTTGGCAGGGGGAYGGNGGNGSSGTGGSSYGNAAVPTFLGSGGGGGTPCGNAASVGGDGGGAIRVEAQDTITILGTIDADGENVSNVNFPGGGGSGGTIYLSAANITGDGILTANGGNGANNQSDSGNGGGGRIAVYTTTSNTFTGTITAVKGTGGLGGTNGTSVADVIHNTVLKGGTVLRGGMTLGGQQ